MRTESLIPETSPLVGDHPDAQFIKIDPLHDARWDTWVSALGGSSFFQTSHWARVLVDTYGHRPFYHCSVSSGQPQSLVPVMEVSSPWTGRRGVSLPFTDVAPVFISNLESPQNVYSALVRCGRGRGWRYLECRSDEFRAVSDRPSLKFYGHVVELNSKQDVLFANMESATRRGIRKAQESNFELEFATSIEAMQSFYTLHCRTRHRHGVPPQPFKFFENIVRHVLQAGHGFVALAHLSGKPVAAAVFFHHRREAIYKFGASDQRYQQLRPNNLLMWESMKRCVEMGCDRLHMGRTSLGQEGLRRFKLGFGAREQAIQYYKYDFRKNSFVTEADRARGSITTVFKYFPSPLFRLAGRLLYSHLS